MIRSQRVEQLPLGVAIGTVVAAGLCWIGSSVTGGPGVRFPAVPAALATFLVVQLSSSGARWRTERVLGPRNLGLLLFWLQLVAIPAIISINGPNPGVLRSLPPDRLINLAILLQSLSYVAFSMGAAVQLYRRGRPRLIANFRLTRRVGLWFIVLGLAGTYLRFGSPAAVVAYFAGRGDVFSTGPASLSQAASTVLRPFGSYGLITIWCVSLLRSGPRRRMSAAQIAMLVGSLAFAATFNYNRAAVVVPIVAILTAYGRFGRRLSLKAIAGVVFALVLLGFLFGQYRTIYIGTHGGEISRADAQLDGPPEKLTDSLEVYGNGPQFWAQTLDEVERNGYVHGSTVVGSVLLPVPVLGGPFRDSSGPTRYNFEIYGQPGITDQVLGFGPELYWNFGLLGLIVGYLGLGIVVRRLDDAVVAAADPLACYTISYIGLWMALLVINSISVASQILVYFAWPIVIMWILSRNSVIGPETAPSPVFRGLLLPTAGQARSSRWEG